MPPKHLNFILFAGLVSLVCYSTFQFIRPALVIGDAMQLIDRYYVEPVDSEALVGAAMNGLTGELDENSSFIAASAYDSFQNTINQEFAGIGILIEQPEPTRPVRVITPMVGSPALRAGFLPGDEIVDVAGNDVSAMEINEVSKLLRGPIGTTVEVKVRRDEQVVDLSVRRETIPLESVVGDHRDASDDWVYRLAEASEIAYIRLTTFGDKTPQELERTLRELDNDFAALILDFRGNGGGLLSTAVAVCDMFLDGGRIVSTKTRGGVLEDTWEATPGTLVDSEKPILVLIDGNSASASEIVAACLQDHGRAKVAGVRSYGKGTVQNILPLQLGRSALRLTVANFYRPNDHNIHRGRQATEADEWGVVPDAGLFVPVDLKKERFILRRWRRASFPLIADEVPDEETTDGDTDSVDNEGEADRQDEIGEAAPRRPADPPLGPPITGDPPLDQALHYLRGQIRASEPGAAAPTPVAA